MKIPKKWHKFILPFLAYHRVIVYISVAKNRIANGRTGSSMVKLVAMFKTPEDVQKFDSHYNEIHAPLVRKWPGLRKFEVARITGAPIGEPKHYLIAEMYFDSQDALQRALASAEGKAAARDVMDFAGNLVSMFYADVNEG